MVQQIESTHVAIPFKNLLKLRGWHCENIHGNQYQEGLPDCYISKKGFMPKWIEFKVIDDYNHVHLTRAQSIKFPILIASDVPIYAICAKDIRGTSTVQMHHRERLYSKLFDVPNGVYLLNPATHCLAY
jgi:hypothetical protein